MDQMKLPLEGVRVLDLSRVLAGPYCAMLLSFLGAEVIKVEDPKGDESRYWPPYLNDDMGCNFLGMNLNKKSIVVDLKQPEGQQLVKDLVARSDVLVENFKTGTMEKFGLDYETLRAVNPRLVYTSISAFGRIGPKAADPGYEALVQAYTGVMNITGHPDGEPARCGVSFLDMSTGVTSALATVSALFQREHTGEGCRLDASLLQSALGLMTMQVSTFFQRGVVPRRLGTAHPQVVPYQAYPTADGDIFIASGNQNLWERLCRVLGREDLIDNPLFKDNPTRVANREACVAVIHEEVGKWKTDELMAELKRAGVPGSKVNTLKDLIDDGQVEAIGALAALSDDTYGDLRVSNLPFFVNGNPGSVRQRAPRLGEHTREVLEALGYDERAIQALEGGGVVRCA